MLPVNRLNSSIKNKNKNQKKNRPSDWVKKIAFSYCVITRYTLKTHSSTIRNKKKEKLTSQTRGRNSDFMTVKSNFK